MPPRALIVAERYLAGASLHGPDRLTIDGGFSSLAGNALHGTPVDATIDALPLDGAGCHTCPP